MDVALYEPDDVAVKDYSEMSYTEAFDAFFEVARKEYAFNGVDGKRAGLGRGVRGDPAARGAGGSGPRRVRVLTWRCAT